MQSKTRVENVETLVYRVGDYLTDNDRYLYYVKHIHPNGTYDLENCRTGFTLTVDAHFIKYLEKVKRNLKLPTPLPDI